MGAKRSVPTIYTGRAVVGTLRFAHPTPLTGRRRGPRISDETGPGRRSFPHGSGSTFAAMSGARVTRYVALLHLRTQTARSGCERFLSLVAPSALSQVKPCVRIEPKKNGCGVSTATCCARTGGLKRTAAIAKENDPGVLRMTSILRRYIPLV